MGNENVDGWRGDMERMDDGEYGVWLRMCQFGRWIVEMQQREKGVKPKVK
jgi:hypothetical protein